MSQSKKYVLGLDASHIIANGIQKITDIVSVTMGKYGKSIVVIDKNYSSLDVISTKDGISLISNFKHDDELEKIGVSIARKASMATLISAGDGTSTTLILLNSMIKSFLDIAESQPNINIINLKKCLLAAKDKILNYLKKHCIKRILRDKSIIKDIAYTSCRDLEYAQLLFDIFKNIDNPKISIKSTNKGKSYFEVSDGVIVPTERISSPLFVNNFRIASWVHDTTNVVVCDEYIQSLEKIYRILEVSDVSVPLLIICKGIDKVCISALELNIQKANRSVCCVCFDHLLGEDVFSDIADYCGASLMTASNGIVNSAIRSEFLGLADFVKFDSNSNSLLIRSSNKKDIFDIKKMSLEEKLKTLNESAQHEFNRKDISILENRLDRFKCKNVTLYINTSTDTGFQEAFDRLEDAIRSVQSSIKNGYTIGCCNPLLRISNFLQNLEKDLDSDRYKKNISDTHDSVVKILSSALEEPFKIVLTNGHVTIDRIEQLKDIFKRTRTYQCKGYYNFNTNAFTLLDYKFSKGNTPVPYDSFDSVYSSICHSIDGFIYFLDIGGIMYDHQSPKQNA